MNKSKPFNLNIPRNIQSSVSDPNFQAFINAPEDESQPAELLIMDVIGEDFFGDGVSAMGVVDFLGRNRGREIHARINSPGGLVYDGLVIYNGLLNHDADVTVTIEGLAFSAASFIAMAGDTIRMFEASDLGIHRAWGGGIGNAKTLRSAAEWLDTIDEHLVEIFQQRTGKDREQIVDWLDGSDDGTLFSAKDAVANCFADELVAPRKKQSRNKARSQNEKRIEAKKQADAVAVRMRLLDLDEHAA